MSERTPDEIRAEIATERERLDGDLARLQSEIKSLAMLAAAGVLVVRLVTWRRVWKRFR